MASDSMEPAPASAPRGKSLLWKVWAVSPLVALANAGAILFLSPRSFLAYLDQNPDSLAGLAVRGTMIVPMAIWAVLNVYLLVILLLRSGGGIAHARKERGAATPKDAVPKENKPRPKKLEEPRFICKSCGFVGTPQQKKPGHGLIEALLWFFYLIPGLFYSIWRSKAAHRACPSCGSKELIPIESPLGRKLAAEINPGSA